LLQNEIEVKTLIKSFVRERNYINKIAFSDSVTLYQLDLFDWIRERYLKTRGMILINHWKDLERANMRFMERNLLGG
jgi:hypothetical protein